MNDRKYDTLLERLKVLLSQVIMNYKKANFFFFFKIFLGDEERNQFSWLPDGWDSKRKDKHFLLYITIWGCMPSSSFTTLAQVEYSYMDKSIRDVNSPKDYTWWHGLYVFVNLNIYKYLNFVCIQQNIKSKKEKDYHIALSNKKRKSQHITSCAYYYGNESA